MDQDISTSAQASAELIMTAHAEFLDAALEELKRLDRRLKSEMQLAPDTWLCSVPDAPAFIRKVMHERPVFVRHLAPVQNVVPLTNTEQDLGTLAVALADLPTFTLLERGQRFAVQTRMAQGEEGHEKRVYSGGKINQTLAEAIAEETGAVESIRKPQIVVSLLCAIDTAYLGISPAQENLSDWPGGMRHFAQTPEQISRAEFKLLEALEVFGVELPSSGWALDLGAAPGGWTRLLLEAGMHVVAVDPAKLDPRLARRPRLEHYRGYAETYLEENAKTRRKFDIIANDMRMDAREAARLLVQARAILRPEGFILSVLKLPHAAPNIDPLRNLREALSLLSRHFGVVEAKQLFHNRQEVTVITARPRTTQV